MEEQAHDVYTNETASGADQIQPLDLISLAINDVTANDEERETLRQLYSTGGFGGEEFGCRNEDDARALVTQKLAALRDDEKA